MQYILSKKRIVHTLHMIALAIFIPTSTFGYGIKFTNYVTNQYLASVEEVTKEPISEVGTQPTNVFQSAKSIFSIDEIKSSPQTSVESLKLAFKATTVDTNPFKKMINTDLITQLNIIEGNKGKKSNNFINRLIVDENNEALLKTFVGKAGFVKLLTQPTNSVKIIKQRQSTIKRLVADEKLLAECSEVLDAFKSAELSFLEYFKSQNDLKSQLINRLYFKANFFNHSSFMLGTTTRWSRFIQGLFNIVFIGSVFTIFLDEPSIIPLVAGPIILSALNPIPDIKLNMRILNYLQKELINVSTCVRSAEKLAMLLKDEAISESLESLAVTAESYNKSANFNRLINNLLTTTFSSYSSSVFSNLGRILTTHKYMENEEVIKEFNLMLHTVGKLDAYVAVAKKIKECRKKSINFSFVDFIKNQKKSSHKGY